MKSVNDHHRTIIECINSLHIAIDQAGGSILSTEQLEKMSAMDFLSMIAPNNIKFVCDKKRQTTNNDGLDDSDPY